MHGSVEQVGVDNGYRKRKHGPDTAVTSSRDQGERRVVARHQGRVRGSGGTIAGMGGKNTRPRRAIREFAALKKFDIDIFLKYYSSFEKNFGTNIMCNFIVCDFHMICNYLSHVNDISRYNSH